MKDFIKLGYYYFLIYVDYLDRQVRDNELSVTNLSNNLHQIVESRIYHLENKINQLEIDINSTIIFKDHTFEEKFFITEAGLRPYIWEKELFTVFSREESTGRIVHNFDIVKYEGYKKVNFIFKGLLVIWPTVPVVPEIFALTNPRELRLVTTKSIFEFDLFDLEKEAGIKGFLRYCIDVRQSLQSYNLNKGYVVNNNIFTFPYINELARKYCNEWWNIGDLNLKSRIFKAVCNLFVLGIFAKINIALQNLEVARVDIDHPDFIALSLEIEDVKSSFRILNAWFYSNLDNSIKQHLKKSKVHIANDIYAGFDTEYVPLEWGSNMLVSGQLSIASGYKIIIPINRPYEYEGVNTATGETYIRTIPFLAELADQYIETVRDRIEECRDVLYPGFDAAIKNIHEFMLSSPRWFQQGVTDKYHLFQIKRSSIKNILIVPQEGEQLKIKFDSLIDIIRNRMLEHMSWIETLENMLEKAAVQKTFGIRSNNKTEWAWENNFMVCPIEVLELSNEMNAEKHEKFKRSYRTNDHVTCRNRIYLAAHYNAADLGMLEDWAEISHGNIDILKKSYTSLSSPIKSLGLEVHIRDTILLSSAAASSLEAVGKAYGLNKVAINSKWYSQMDKLLVQDFKLFQDYAMQDSLITLVHTLFMNDFVFKLGDFKVPCTLGSIATKYLKSKWRLDNYRGYQANPEFLIGRSNSHTPKGLNALGLVGDGLNQFIASFRGGRNECYAYGIDTERRWFDYDLTSCYSTVMSMCGDPKYKESIDLQKEQEEMLESSLLLEDRVKLASLLNNAKTPQDLTPPESLIEEDSTAEKNKIINKSIEERSFEEQEEESELAALTPTVGRLCRDPDYNFASSITPGYYNDILNKYDFENSYAALRVSFNFSPKVIYPPIPVQVKCNNTFQTVYPLNGESTITGLEFLSACNIIKIYGGFIKVLSGTIIPFKEDKIVKEKKLFEGEEIWVERTIPAYSPFADVIKELQANRSKWKKLTGKKSAMERIYKDLGNMLYGKVVAGISNKDKYDSRLLANKLLLAGDLTNPLIGAWITGFVRALLAELLNYTNMLGGKITAVTTDGFVTDIEDLESKILEKMKELNIKNSFLHKYIKSRVALSGDKNAEALEVKTNVRGIAQWTTRGQISINHTDPALNNFQVPISAMTGFQSRQFSHNENIKMVIDSLKTNNVIFFMQHRLSGALENYKEKHDVSMFSSLRKYRTIFDSKRIIVPAENGMLFTYPYINADAFVLNRTILDQFRQSIYSAQYSRLFVKNVTSSNVIEDMLKYIVRLFAAKFNWILSYQDKFFLIKELQKVLTKTIFNFSEDKLLDMINDILQNPGIIVNKLVVFRLTQDFIDILFEDNSKLVNLLNLRFAFSNFNLPAPTLSELNSRYLSIKRFVDSSTIEMKNIKSRLDILNFFEPILTVPISASANNNQVIVNINGRKFLALD